MGDHCIDAVKIYDGASTSATKLGEYCGTDTPPDFTSTGNTLHIIFRSDFKKQERGFDAAYQAVGIPSAGTGMTIKLIQF